LSYAPFDTDFAHSVMAAKYMRPNGETRWEQTAERAVKHPLEALENESGCWYGPEKEQLFKLVNHRSFMPGGRYLYASGNDFHQVQNCLLLRCEDSREGWADLAWKAEMSLLTGAGIGVYWGDVRAGGTRVKRTGGVASGPLPKAIAVNEQGRAAVQGGDRRAAIWGGLLWSHPDIFKWINAKDWPDYIKAQKAIDPSIPADLDMTNISVCLDDQFFEAFEDPYHDLYPMAHGVYWATIDKMTQTGEPGFSIDLGDKSDEKLRNACTEIVSADDSDICNLGGLVLPRFDSPRQFGDAVRLATLYLTAGTVYSDLPYDKVGEVRDKNRRLGLDLIGVHEFCLQRGVAYGSDDALEMLDPYMAEYERATEYAHDWQDGAGLSLSVATRSGAPTGTRAIGAESTTGWEPVTAAAYKRAVITSKAHERDERAVHYVVDPTVARLVKEGYIREGDPVEDSYSLAEDYERRFRMQAYAQSKVDQAISMTINLPHVMRDPAERRSFGLTLYKYLPKLRGITVYPNGAIAGQPITPVPLSEALAANNLSIEESEDKCAAGACGI
jgi:ribonucleoside-diphosphate reductase alpha chain